MSTIIKYHILYLHPSVESEQWEHLHQYLRPGSRNQPGWNMIICKNLDIGHGLFLSCDAKAWGDGGVRHIHIRYELVASIVEVGAQDFQLGFISSANDHGSKNDKVRENYSS